MKEIVVYSDGSCFPNPGFGAWAAVILDPDKSNNITLSGTERQSTNNRMEIFGIIAVLESLPRQAHKVTLHTDSMYLVRAVNDWMGKWERNGWQRKVKKQGMQPIKNADLFQRLATQRLFHKLTAIWVRGHNGDKWNEYCDMIANGLVAEHYQNRK